MDYVCLHDKKEIEHFLNKDIYLHNYSLGDLDDFFWPYTTWYAQKLDGEIKAIALLYVGEELPTLLALSDELDIMADLLISIRHLLPIRFYAHLSPGLEEALQKKYSLESRGLHHKMALLDNTHIPQVIASHVVRLNTNDLDTIQVLYNESYPRNWFNARMLETGQYFGIKEGNRLISIAGIHVYSPLYKVAALGNITTLPNHRNNGLGKQTTIRLCQALLQEDIRIGLNVKADNTAAIKCYEQIGFKTVSSYNEFEVQQKSSLNKENHF